MPANYVSHDWRYCHNCGEKIEKRKKQAWTVYSKRKYCSKSECIKSIRKGKGSNLAEGKMNPDSKDNMAISDYIGERSRNGRLMADYNIGVLEKVEKIGNDIESVEGYARGVICTYKGIQVTGNDIKTANQWLMDNWMGKAGQRNAPIEVDNRNESEKLTEMEYILKELGYRMVKIE